MLVNLGQESGTLKLCITKIEETTIRDAKDSDLVKPMYNQIDYILK